MSIIKENKNNSESLITTIKNKNSQDLNGSNRKIEKYFNSKFKD